MKVKVAITNCSIDQSSDSDYETAIELVHYDFTEEVVEGVIDGVVPFSIRRTVTSSSSSFYEENEVEGGYGPGLEYDPQYDRCSVSINFTLGHYWVNHRDLSDAILAYEKSDFEVEIGLCVLSDLFDAKLDLLIESHAKKAHRALRKSSQIAKKMIEAKAIQALQEFKAA